MKHWKSKLGLPQRWIAWLMALLLLTGGFAGCNRAGQGDSDTAWESGTPTQPPATEQETDQPDQTDSPDDPETPDPTDLITEISDAEDLVKLAESVNAGNHYEGVTVKLMADIDLNSIENYTPIGWGEKMLTDSMGKPVSFAPYFGGTFDGQGHVIRGSLESRQEGYTGIFGMLSGATVCNLGLELEVALNYCNLHHGALAGYAYNTTIEKCYFKGSIENAGSFDYEPDKQPDDNVGGFVGTAYGTLNIRDSYVDADMYRASRWSIGGLVGMIGAGAEVTVENCYSASTVSDCYGGDGDGCLLGNSTSINISVINSYALDIYGDPLTGSNIPPKVFDDASGFVNINQLKGMAETLGEAFRQNPNGFPALVWETVESDGETPEPIYEIADLEDWNAFVQSVNDGYSYEGETVLLTADLDFTGVKTFVPAGWNETYLEPGWMSPVNLRETKYFAGTFDGQGHCITGLSADATHGCWGVFGTTYNATIRNLGVNADFTDHLNSQKFFAILIGLAYNTTVESCRVSGSYSTLGSEGFSTQCNGGVIGGAIGEITVRNTICDADLTGVAQTEGGAFVGYLWTNETSVTIENCYVYAPDVRALWWKPEDYVNSGVFAGGLQDGAELHIINCYALLTNEGAVTNLTVDDEKYLDDVSRFVTLTELKDLAETLGDGYQATENGLPVLVWEDASASTVPDDGSTDESDPIYEIHSVRDWNQFVNSIAAGYTYAGETVRLFADLDFTEISFRSAAENLQLGDLAIVGWGGGEPALTGVCYFAGTFDGQGHSMIGISKTYSAGYAGIFGVTVGAVIRNLHLQAQVSHMSAGWNNGLLIGYAVDTTVESCLIEGSFETSSAQLCGGVIGTAFGSVSIRNTACNLDLTGFMAGYSGGLVGYAFHDSTQVTVENCYVRTADIVGQNNETAFLIGGGTGRQIVRNCYAAVADTEAVSSPLTKSTALDIDDQSAIVSEEALKQMAETLGSGFVQGTDGYPVPAGSLSAG